MKTGRQHAWDVFIAHSASDVLRAEELFRLLKPYKTFLATKSLLPGDDWDRELRLAQQHSLLTVVLVSSKTKQSYYQRDEIAAAIAMARENRTAHRVVPVFLDGLSPRRRIPYGLQIKHGLSVDSGGDLKAIARRLKATLTHLKADRAVPTKNGGHKRRHRGRVTLSEAIAGLEHDDFVDEVLLPLLQVVHAGTVEYVGLSPDFGRAILSLGQDCLKRPHSLCVQPISGKVLIDDTQLDSLITQCRDWKSSEVMKDAGTTSRIDELWIFSALEASFAQKPLLAQEIRNLSGQAIKFIWRDEICSLLMDHLPNVASRLSKYATPEVISLISALSKHTEGRAFGFSNDRSIVDFYVTAALSAHATRAYASVRGDIAIGNGQKRIHLPLSKLVRADEITEDDEVLKTLIEERILNHVTKGILDEYGVKIGITLNETISRIKENYFKSSFFKATDIVNLKRFLIEPKETSEKLSNFIYSLFSSAAKDAVSNYEESDSNTLQVVADELNRILKGPCIFSIKNFGLVALSSEAQTMLGRKCTGPELIILNRTLIEDGFPFEVARNEYWRNTVLKIDLTFHLEPVFKRLVNETRIAIKACPSVLKDDVSLVKRAWQRLELTENFVKSVSENLNLHSEQVFNHVHDYVKNPIRIRVPHPEYLLKLNKRVLVEGAPGCGKTTLLKMLAINLLTKARKVHYLPCSTIRTEFRSAPLMEIVEKFSFGSPAKKGTREKSILIIDGLDEAAFDLSDRITDSRKRFDNLIISTRSTFETAIRDDSFRVALSPFDDKERDQFFEKWFVHNPELLTQARELMSKHADIDTHTRIPLIATITVALLQNGFVPKTRAEIYAFRLELLLSKWDRFRGVDRLYVDNPDAKRRFLRELAFQMHSSPDRRRNVGLEELRNVYEHSLGEWGYNISYEKVLKDLIIGSGILIEDRIGVYSFGHLTFQEHLAAEFIAETFPTYKIAQLLGSDWWREPLNFYASIKGNITDLIDHMMSGLNYMMYLRQLSEMATYAPYTSPGAIQCIQDSLADVLQSERAELQEDFF